MTTSEKLDKLAREYDRAFHTVTESDYYRLMELLRGAAQSASVAVGVIEIDATNQYHSDLDEARAQVTELTKDRDALDANRNRLIAIINSNLNERDEARAQVTALTAENAVMREAIGQFLYHEKTCSGYEPSLGLYDRAHDRLIELAESTPNPAAMSMVEELERHRAFVKQQSDALDDFHNNEVALYNAALTEGEKG